jgi:hypothetical protein
MLTRQILLDAVLKVLEGPDPQSFAEIVRRFHALPPELKGPLLGGTLRELAATLTFADLLILLGAIEEVANK